MLLWDENVYLGNARNHITESNFTEDFRFPFLEYILAFIWFFTGESVFIAQLVIILFTLASVLFIYLIAKEYFSKRFSFLLSLLFSLCPLILFWGFRIYADIPAMFFLILSFYFLLKYEKYENQKVFVILAAIAAALAFLTRFPTALFVLGIGIYFIIKKRFIDLYIFIFFFLFTLAPWLIYNYLTYGNLIWDLQEQFLVVQQWTYFEPVTKQIMNFFIFTNFLIPLLFLFGIYVIITKKKLNYKLNLLTLIYVVISFIYYFFFVKLKDERYYLAFLPFIYIVSFQALDWLKKKEKKIFSYAFIFLIIALLFNSIFIFGYLATKNYCEKNNSIIESMNYLENKINENDIILGNAWLWHAYKLNVRSFSLWDEDIDMLLDNHAPIYIIYNDKIGISYNKEILDNSTRLEMEKKFVGNCGEKTYLYKVLD